MHFRIALVATAVATMACGGGETAQNDSSAAASASPNVVTITASDFAFQAPDTIPAGLTEIRLVNQGPNLHHAQIVRLDSAKTYEDLMAAMKNMKPTDTPPVWMIPAGGPNPPNTSETAVLIQNLDPGNYAILCFVDIPDHVPHVMKGMTKKLTVVPATGTSTATAPTADVTMQLVDYDFTVTPTLTAGKHVIKIENAAQQPHEVFIAKLDSGKTMADVSKWMETMQGTAPAHAMGGVAFIPPGTSVFMPVDLPAGDYMMICFVPDVKDGKPHFMKGMAKEIKVS